MTSHTGIFNMNTVSCVGVIGAVEKSILKSPALHIINVNRSSALAKGSKYQSSSIYKHVKTYSIKALYPVCNSILCSEYPSCLQATAASTVPQKSSQTVPHTRFKQTSTLPSYWLVPPTNLISPSVHSLWHCTLASSA